MTCVFCKADTGRRDTLELRIAGWFVWAREAPTKFHGCVVCPACLERLGLFMEMLKALDGHGDGREHALRLVDTTVEAINWHTAAGKWSRATGP